MKIPYLAIIVAVFLSTLAFAQPYLGSLEVNETFTLSRETPIVNDFNPSDPMAAISDMERLSPGTKVKVLKVDYQDRVNKSRVFYFVEVLSPENLKGTNGWINGVALMGQ
ncbi:MAG: hypothetical protein WD000_09550 [Thermodesulfobacteriota bacterium]